MDNSKNIFFSTNGMAIKDDKIWFSARETNGLFCMDINGENLKYIGSFPKEPEDMKYLYGECALDGDDIFFVPYLAQELAVYNMKNMQFQKCPFNKKIYENYYLAVIKWKDALILLPSQNSNRVIVKFNIKSREFQYITEWQDKFAINDNEKELFFDYCIKGNVLYAPVIASQGQIMKYNLENQDISCIQVDASESYRTICCNKENFYLYSQKENKLIILDEHFQILDMQVIGECNGLKINNIVYQNGHVFLFSVNSYDSMLDDMVIEYDVKLKKTQIIICSSCYQGRANYAGAGRRFTIFYDSNNRIYSLNGGNGILYEIDTENMEVKEHKIQRIDVLPILQEKYIRNNGNVVYIEKKNGRRLLDFLLEQSNTSEFNQRKLCGEIIWEKITS